MIYLIGGPPKCGKTTLAKRLSKSLGIPWVSTDTLQCVIKPYINRKDFSKKPAQIFAVSAKSHKKAQPEHFFLYTSGQPKL